MTMTLHTSGSASIDELKMRLLTKRDTVYRKLLELAVGRALYAGSFGSLPRHIVGGIIGTTAYGDRYPELVLDRDYRLRPTEFGASVLNSGVGHCAIVFGLRGPQFTLTEELPVRTLVNMSATQIAAGRADLMVMCSFDDVKLASAAVLASEYVSESMGSRS